MPGRMAISSLGQCSTTLLQYIKVKMNRPPMGNFTYQKTMGHRMGSMAT